MIYRALAASGVELDADGHTFVDVGDDATHGTAIGALAAAEVIGGYSDREFGPADQVSRGQLASLLDRANAEFGVGFDRADDHGFNDVTDNATHSGAIGALVAAGIIDGYGDGSFGPDDPISRGQAASLFIRWLTSSTDE